MRIVKISKHFYRICTEEKISKELMYNKLGRPCVLLLSLHLIILSNTPSYENAKAVGFPAASIFSIGLILQF